MIMKILQTLEINFGLFYIFISPSTACVKAKQDKIFVNIQNKIIKCLEENYDQHFLWLGHRIFTKGVPPLHPRYAGGARGGYPLST